MNKQRLLDIINNDNIQDILYDNEHVWVQEIKNDTATIGFLNGNPEKEVFITDLQEEKSVHIFD